ncbi:MAG: 4Fe-4S dicluster domain-containing protein, partial [Myxococcales bacterium]|nr:4Fe-4S dicluster domain-containing protein [Myxococcales bacterium]
LRCIFCGFCVEACPCDAIRMDTGAHMPPSTSRSHFIYERETLMSLPGKDGSYLTDNPRHEPGDDSHPGIDRERAH